MIERDGYLFTLAPWHPFCYRDGYVRTHRLVMEDMLGRLLWPWEDVHHKNGKRDDNRPENLELIDHRAHASLHSRIQHQTPYTDADLIECRRQGMSNLEIGRKYGRSESAIRKQLQRIGLLPLPVHNHGERNGFSRLTEAQVIEARRLRRSDPRQWTHRALGDRYGASESTMRAATSDLPRGRTWTHLDKIEPPCPMYPRGRGWRKGK